MRILLLSFLLIAINAFSQDITGKWYGTLQISDVKIPLAFNFEIGTMGYTGTMDSPSQNALGIPIDEVELTTTGNLVLKIKAAGISYKGHFEKEEFTGEFKQNGMILPLTLSRKDPTFRPQNPVEPFPYTAEEVVFRNEKANISFAGTFTKPKDIKAFPTVILISGSGPENRDEEIFGHKPFLVLSDYLTRNNIAVLRFDERGTGESGGEFEGATTFDFAEDVEAAMEYLKTREDVDPAKIGLVGHSEGGLIAPIIASRNKDAAFIVMLAGPGLPGDQLLILQQHKLYESLGLSEKEIDKICKTNDRIFSEMKVISEEPLENAIQRVWLESNKDSINPAELKSLMDPWLVTFIRIDPGDYLKEVTCPVLALNGEKDLQVPAEENLRAIKAFLKTAGNRNFTTLELKGLNHLFQECKTCKIEEYGTLVQTFSPDAMKVIADWINKESK